MFFWRVYEFSFDFGWISRKMDEISKSGQFQGPTSWHRDPTQQRKSMPRCDREGGLDKPRVRRGVAKLRRSIAVLRCGIALFTYMCFCHVFLFRYFEDLSIRLMRTL